MLYNNSVYFCSVTTDSSRRRKISQRASLSNVPMLVVLIISTVLVRALVPATTSKYASLATLETRLSLLSPLIPNKRQYDVSDSRRRQIQVSLQRRRKSIPYTLRGGGLSLLNSATTISTDDDNTKKKKTNDWGISLSLSLSYFTVMGAKCALPAVLSSLVAPSPTGLTFPMNKEPQQLIAKLLFASTLAIASGKLLLGPFIDSIGGIRSLQVALSGLAMALGVITFSQSFTVFAISWIIIDFIFSSCWAACINAIHQSFPNNDKEQWSQQIGYIAAAARMGNAVAFTVFATTLQYFGGGRSSMKQSWRPVFAISSVSQLIPLVLLSYYSKRVGNQRTAITETQTTTSNSVKTTIASSANTIPVQDDNIRTKLRNSIRILRKEAKTLDFWLHLVSRSVLMVYASFLLFVPTLLNNVYQASSATAARVGSLYALGCLTAVTVVAPIYNRISVSSKNKFQHFLAITVLLLVGATGTSLAQLGHMMGIWELSVGVSALSMFVWGLSFSIPFYIPPSVYALRRGGAISAATIADVFDIGGFALLATFNGYVASIPSKAIPSSWIGTFQLTTLCSLLSYIALSIAILRNNDNDD